MATSVSALTKIPVSAIVKGTGSKPSKELMLEHSANEFVFAVVGHVGSGTTKVAEALEGLLRDEKLEGEKFEVVTLKARDVIFDWAASKGTELPKAPDKNGGEKPSIQSTQIYQNWGDKLRGPEGLNDLAAVGRGLIQKIRFKRAELTKTKADPKEPVLPDGKPRAYILDSIRHPAEVQLLRHVYQDAFILIGVVCETE